MEVAAQAAGVEGVGVHTLRAPRGGRLAGGRCTHQGGGRSAGALLDRHRRDSYGHASDATTRAAIDGLTNTLGL